MQRDNPGVDVIVLDLNKLNIKYNEYNMLSAREQIDHISKLISETIEKFKADDNHNMKIFVWREYGIANPKSLFCDNETRTYLKNTMQALTQAHPDICIISGTVSTKKHFDQFSIKDKEKIKEAYEHPLLQTFINLEKSPHFKFNPDVGGVKMHADQLDTLNTTNGIDVVRNSCYIFQGENTYRHDKLVPFYETRELGSKSIPDNAVFRPSKGLTANPLIELTHPITQKPFTVAVEICAEHANGYLKHELNKKNDPDKKPDLHVVISDPVQIIPENICADYFIQADSARVSRLITSDSPENTNINYYQANLLQPSLPLRGPLEKTTVSELRLNAEVLSFANRVITGYENKDDEFTVLITRYFIQFQNDISRMNKDNNIKQDLTPALESLHNKLTEELLNRVTELDTLEKSSFISFFTDYSRKRELNTSCRQLDYLINQTGKFAMDSHKIMGNYPSPIKKI